MSLDCIQDYGQGLFLPICEKLCGLKAFSDITTATFSSSYRITASYTSYSVALASFKVHVRLATSTNARFLALFHLGCSYFLFVLGE